MKFSISIKKSCRVILKVINSHIFNFFQKTEIRNILKSKDYGICLEDSVFQRICKQITNLSLIGNENKIGILCKNYTMNVYAIILIFFKNLKHLTIAPLSIDNHLPLSLKALPPSTFSSSTLTKLCINVLYFDDCLALLDGRLKQLVTFIVHIDFIYDMPSISYNMVSL